jgi:hypothetical protein
MVIKYWKAVHKRALKEARHALWIETGERAVIAIAVIGVSIVLLWIVGGREMATTEIIIRAAVTAAIIFVFPFVYLWKLTSLPATMNNDLVQQISAYEKDKVQINILKVDFDPNGPNEIYVDFLLSNPGEPTTLRNWTLSVFAPSGEKLDRVAPRLVHTLTTFVPPGLPVVENLAFTPLEKGGAREGCRVTYTHDQPTKAIFGKTGTRFWLRTNDVKGRTIEAEYDL